MSAVLRVIVGIVAIAGLVLAGLAFGGGTGSLLSLAEPQRRQWAWRAKQRAMGRRNDGSRETHESGTRSAATWMTRSRRMLRIPFKRHSTARSQRCCAKTPLAQSKRSLRRTRCTPGATRVGRDAIVAHFRRAVESLVEGWIRSDSVAACGEIAYETGTNAMTFVTSDGTRTTINGRYLTVWRRSDDGSSRTRQP